MNQRYKKDYLKSKKRLRINQSVIHKAKVHESQRVTNRLICHYD